MSHNLLFSTDPNHRWSPRHLQAMSYLYGLHTPDSDHATVLELGCGMGVNLLPFAVAYPNANATGIDIDGEKIAAGQLHLAQHGIKNITLYTADIANLLESELEQYDYILIRGLFAQTDLETRTALLSWCQKHLSPDGIICIGYQTYPGSKVTDSLYEAFAFHAAQSEQPEEQVAGIKAMLSFMSEGISSSNPLYKQINPALHILEEKDDEQLYIETFSGLHNPCYFIEFANSLTNTGLCYVGDADAHTEIPAHWGNDTEHLYQVINPQKNKVFGQQYLDLLCGRATRMSILTHAAHAERIEFEPNTDKLIDLRWAGYFHQIETNENNLTNQFLNIYQKPLKIDDSETQSILNSLGYVWPFSLDFNHIIINSRGYADILNNNPSLIESYKNKLKNIFIKKSSYFRFSLRETPYDLNKNTKISFLEKELKVENKNYHLNLWHDANYFNPQDYKKESSEVNIEKISTIIYLDKIQNLRRKSLLIGSYFAWGKYYFQVFKKNINNHKILNQYIIFLFLFNHPHLINKSFSKKPKSDFFIDKNLEKKEKSKLLKKNHLERIKYLKDNIKKHTNTSSAWYELHVSKLLSHTLKDNSSIFKALSINPKVINYYTAYAAGNGHLFQYTTKIPELLNRIIELEPNNNDAWSNLATYAYFNRSSNKNLLLYKKAAQIAPDNHIILSNLAGFYSNIGKHEKAIKLYEKIVLSDKEENFQIHSNYLFSAIHCDIYNPEKLFSMHKEYGNRVTQWAKQQNWQPTYNVNIPANRPLLIGFVSGDLRDHAVTKFLLPYWESLDKNKFTIYAYHNHSVEDHISTRLKTHTKNWLNVYSMNHLELAQQINSDQIDILIDLSGHTAHNRLPVFGLKPAPVQMTWIGYPATTGLEQMDYKIVALSVQNNPIFKPQFTEEFITLRSLGRSFDSTFSASVNTKSIPVLRNGYFTFASFNRPQKISQKVLKAWAEIMQQCPNDKLLIANMPDKEMIENFTDILINYGAKHEQLLFKERVDLAGYLELHNEIDLILDTFPYNGGTTARHAISMGVPAIHIEGKTLASHTPIYRHYGLKDFQANNVDEYIEKAVLWSKKPSKLLALRKEISEKFEKINTEPKFDKPNNIKVFEKMLRTIFNHYLENKNPASHIITLE